MRQLIICSGSTAAGSLFRKGSGAKKTNSAAGILFFEGCPAYLRGIPAAVRHQSQADAERFSALVGVFGDVRIIGREHPDGEGYVLAYLRYERDGKGTESVYQADAKSLFPGRAADNDGQSDEACQAKCRNAGICEKEDGRMPKRVKCPYCGYSMLIFLTKKQNVME